MIDPAYSVAGALTGFVVGLTGVGGGALMTPILLLFFGVSPVTAIATDLWFAAITKVVGAKMVHDVIDAAIQVHGAAGVSEDFPLERMYRAARFARIYDGPDEVHIESVGKRLLRSYVHDAPYDFGA